MLDAPKTRPIIFDAESVRAIIAGRKTQTRRVVKLCAIDFIGSIGDNRDDPINWGYEYGNDNWLMLRLPPPGPDRGRDDRQLACPYGQPGDLLWVRETWQAGTWIPSDCGDEWVDWDGEHYEGHRPGEIWYRADRHQDGGGPWCSPIHMPRWASRLTLRITDVRVGRVQEITVGDVLAEGLDLDRHITHEHEAAAAGAELIAKFASRWDQINAKRAPWDSNPWAWALTFEVVNDA